MGSLVRLNFTVALVVTVAGAAWRLVGIAGAHPESLAHLPGSGVGVLAELVLLVLMTPALWYWRYRFWEGHFAAFVVGFIVASPAIGAVAANAINGDFYATGEAWWRAYVAGSHLAYASLRGGAVLKALG